MFHGKKISSDILHLALIMAFVRLGPELLLGNQWQEPFEVGDIGSTLVHPRFYTQSMNMRSSRYIRLKTLDPFILEEETFIWDRFSFLGNNGVFRSNIIAYYSDSASLQASADESSEECGSSVISDAENNVTSGASGGQPEEPPLENVFSPGALELSSEDMDLIEILWKQDIDLGVSRDAFNSHESHEVEKLKAEAGFSKVNKDLPTNHDLEMPVDLEEENVALCNESESFNYIIDSETGEHVIQEPDLNEAKSSSSLKQNLLNFEEFGDLTNSLFLSEDCLSEGLNFTKEFLAEGGEDDLPQALDSFDPDVLANQIEKLEKLMSSDSGINIPEVDSGSEMYPSMEEYWQDISTTLPLSVMNQGSVVPRPSRPFSVASDDHSGASTSSDVAPMSAVSNDALLAETILQNTFLTQRAPEMNSSFAYLSPLLGPTSLGCAVASSIATLTNDSEPMPDTTTSINGTFGLDLLGILPNNQTNPHSNNETLLSELLLNEDLQMMDAASAPPLTHSEGQCRSASMMRIFEPDPDSSDTACSLDYNENKRSKLEELTSASCTGKELIYGAIKYPSKQVPINCGLRELDESHSDPNYEIGVHSSFRGNYSYLQHNHTYHLPFTSGNNVPKPVTRDKGKHLRYDNENTNRDERRAKALELPITISEIINLSIDEFNEKLSKFELTEPQLTLIRDIRRRGKNKVAAQNCRKRKMDQINNLQQDLGLLQEERLQLESERTQLLHQRRNIRDKYSKLCQLVLQSSSSYPPIIPDLPLSEHQSNGSVLPSTSDSNSPDPEEDLGFNQGARTKRKMGKKS